MKKTKLSQHDCRCDRKGDRYVTFIDIDCAGNARRVMEFIEHNTAGAGGSSLFWQYFMAKRQPRSGPVPDDLFLIHSHIDQIRELFEACGDEAALALLTQVEEECC